MYCPHCRQKLNGNEKFCPKCGLTLSQTAGQARPANEAQGVPATGNRTVLTPANQGPAPVPGRTVPANSLTFTFIEAGKECGSGVVSTAKPEMRFGRETDNDLVVSSPTVSAHHGRILLRDGQCYVQDLGSTNGLFLNGQRQSEFRVAVGDVVTIGVPRRGERRCVMVVGESGKSWTTHSLAGKGQLNIGRGEQNDITIKNPTVSMVHCQLMRDQRGDWHIRDAHSSNGTQVNGVYLTNETTLTSGSLVRLGNAILVFLDDSLIVMEQRRGVDVVAHGLVRYRKNGKTTRITTDHVSLHIKRGEFVAIVGGSGCGKSTLLNELNGSEPADEGYVLLDGADLYGDYEMLKTSIGYVPQQDIVYDNLTLVDMLDSAAKLRMQPDSTADDRRARVDEVIKLLELDHVRENFIGRLSGGQKKRASIAVELLADPRLLFLDEPTSGLDPGIERKLMKSLAEMAHDGRTIILVTHTTLNLHLCDQVVFLGAGGKLCFAGRPSDALTFFGVQDFVDVYTKIAGPKDALTWEGRFAKWRAQNDSGEGQAARSGALPTRRTPSPLRQFGTLAGRYAHLLLNDHSRMALLLLQAPLLSLLICLVAGDGCFELFEKTKSCLFALSCAAFWVGILDAIQEICKERDIFKREYEGGEHISSYVASKVAVLGLLCLLQSLMLVAVFCVVIGVPPEPIFSGVVEFFVSVFLTTFSAMCLGLLVSAIFKNPDRAIAMAPLLIMPQILFSGLVFELSGVTESISYAVNCRWAMEALGTTANLNELDLGIYGKEIVVPESEQVLKDQEIDMPEMTEEVNGMEVTIEAKKRTFDEITVKVPEQHETIDAEMYAHDPDDMFDHTAGHLLSSWGVLVLFCVVCVGGCFVLLVSSVRRR